MTKTTLKSTNARIDSLEQKMDMILNLLQNGQTATTTTKGSSKKATKVVDKNAQREQEKTEFKANHKLIRSSKQNKELVYAEMKKQGITEFNRKDYERIAKGLGVLGKNGKVVATWADK
jgi:hypothetical protein